MVRKLEASSIALCEPIDVTVRQRRQRDPWLVARIRGCQSYGAPTLGLEQDRVEIEGGVRTGGIRDPEHHVGRRAGRLRRAAERGDRMQNRTNGTLATPVRIEIDSGVIREVLADAREVRDDLDLMVPQVLAGPIPERIRSGGLPDVPAERTTQRERISASSSRLSTRRATTQPAEPAPTITTSNASAITTLPLQPLAGVVVAVSRASPAARVRTGGRPAWVWPARARAHGRPHGPQMQPPVGRQGSGSSLPGPAHTPVRSPP
jgi:hypothetical protein